MSFYGIVGIIERLMPIWLSITRFVYKLICLNKLRMYIQIVNYAVEIFIL